MSFSPFGLNPANFYWSSSGDENKAGICTASERGLVCAGDGGQIKQMLFIQKLFHPAVTRCVAQRTVSALRHAKPPLQL